MGQDSYGKAIHDSDAEGWETMKERERDILKQVKDYLLWNGWFVIRIHQSLGSTPGIADLCAVKEGFTAWIEVKTMKGVLSEHQIKWSKNLMEHGGHYWVIRSLEDLQGRLAIMDKPF